MWDLNRISFCDECQRQIQRTRFREQFDSHLEETIGENWVGVYDFDDLLDKIKVMDMISGFKPDQVSYTSSILRSIFVSEREDSRESK